MEFVYLFAALRRGVAWGFAIAIAAASCVAWWINDGAGPLRPSAALVLAALLAALGIAAIASRFHAGVMQPGQ